MDPVILDRFAWQLRLEDVLARVRLDRANPEAPQVSRLLEAAHAVGRPKALFREAYIEARGDDSVTIDGIPFHSRVLRINLEPTQRVFACLATCGLELAQWARGLDDMLEQFWADAIMEMALRQAMGALNERIGRIASPSQTSAMNPGSLPDWPITQQRPLFSLIGPAAGAIGITLTDSMLMVPAKSVSELRFPTEVRFESCQLCPRKDCPGRRAPFDAELYRRKYARTR